MSALKDLTKDELLTFIYNLTPPGDINIFDDLAYCFSCGKDYDLNKKYGYECAICQKESNEQD